MTFFMVIILGARDPNVYHQEAVNAGHAYYHPQTGEFTWKEGCMK